MIYQVVIKSSYNHSMIFVIVLAPKCETFPDHWVWNWYNISAVYFRKSKEEVYNILKKEKMIKHDSWKPSVPMDNRELRTNILSSEYFNRKCRRCEKFIKKSEMLLKSREKQMRSLHFTKFQSWSFTVT